MSRETMFSLAEPLPGALVIPAPKGRFILPKGTAARRTEGSEAFSWSEICGGPPAIRPGNTLFFADGSTAAKRGPVTGAGD